MRRGLRTFLIAWHPGQRRWAGGLRYTALLREVLRKMPYERVLELKDPPRGGVLDSGRFWIFYLSATLLHAATVVLSLLGLQKVWRPIGRGLKSALARILLPGIVQDPGSTVLFEIGKSLFGPAALSLLWVPDLQHRRLPRNFSAAQWLNRELNWRGSYDLADGVIASSRAVEQDLLRFWGRRVPVHCWKFPASAPLRREGAARPFAQPYVLYPAQFWPHKGHAELCRAFRQLVAGRSEPALLVLAGRPEAALRELKDWIGREKLEDRIVLVIDAPDETLGALMGGATGLVFPSRFEGWSTGVLEAIALGSPLILSDLPAHLEVGLPAEAYFRTGDADSLRAALGRLFFDPGFRDRVVRSYGALALPTAESFARDVAATLDSLPGGRDPGLARISP